MKLYANHEEGFVGMGLKRTESEFVTDCSDIDDVIVFREDGVMMVSKISQKAFFGKGIIHIGVWKKGDKRTIYNMIYQDGKTGPSMMKRFDVTSITRDKEYDLTKGTPGSKVLWFTANPNGEAETLSIKLKPKSKIRKLKFDLDLSELAIKGRGAKGNRVTKYKIAKIELKEKGVSTLSARKIWFDDTVQRLNSEGRGDFIGEFKAEDKILTIMQSGEYHLTGFDLFTKFEEDMIVIEKWNPNKPISAIYFDGEKEQYFVKRFLVELTDKKILFITEHEKSQLEVVSTDWLPQIKISFAKVKGNQRDDEEVALEEFIAVKGMKAIGNRLTPYKVKNIDLLEPLPYEEPENDENGDEDEMNDSENEENNGVTVEEEANNVDKKELLEQEDEKDDIIVTVEVKETGKEKKGVQPKKKEKKASPIKNSDDDSEENQMKLF